MWRVFSCCAVLAGSPGLGQDLPVLEAAKSGIVISEGMVITGSNFRSNDPWWSHEFRAPRADFMRAQIAVRGAPAPAGTKLVAQNWGEGIRQYEIADRSGDTFWTGVIRGDTLFLSIEGPEPPDGLEIEVISILRQADTVEVFSHWNGNQLQKMDAPDLPGFVHAAAGPVAWLNFTEGAIARNCTGVLISEDTILTNEHCVNTAEACTSMIATFGFQKGTDGKTSFGEEFTCTGFSPDDVSFELDASLVRLRGAPGATWGVAALGRTDPVAPGTQLAVIQHPDGRAKEVSLTDCALTDVPIDGRGSETDFSHTCDTEGGSSGAPVFDHNGDLVGLHHFGFNDTPDANWTENRAVRWNLLRSWLSDRVSPEPQ